MRSPTAVDDVPRWRRRLRCLPGERSHATRPRRSASRNFRWRDPAADSRRSLRRQDRVFGPVRPARVVLATKCRGDSLTCRAFPLTWSTAWRRASATATATRSRMLRWDNISQRQPIRAPGAAGRRRPLRSPVRGGLRQAFPHSTDPEVLRSSLSAVISCVPRAGASAEIENLPLPRPAEPARGHRRYIFAPVECLGEKRELTGVDRIGASASLTRVGRIGSRRAPSASSRSWASPRPSGMRTTRASGAQRASRRRREHARFRHESSLFRLAYPHPVEGVRGQAGETCREILSIPRIGMARRPQSAEKPSVP